jgi:hypothetical protein
MDSSIWILSIKKLIKKISPIFEHFFGGGDGSGGG